jgi:hypothetical protein
MPEQVYLPHDPEEWTAASLYRAVYEVSHGRAMPSFLLLPLPGFVAERFKSSPRLSALVANFPLASRYQAAFASVPFLSSLEAIQKVVLAVPDQA